MLQRCATGEERCTDKSCSTNGFCSIDHGGRQSAQVNTPPAITLRAVTGQTDANSVLLPQGFTYAACDASSTKLPAQPCEPGAAPGSHLSGCGSALLHLLSEAAGTLWPMSLR